MFKKKKNSNKQEKHLSSHTLAKILDMPQNSFDSFSQITLTGNQEAVLDGCQGVVEYEDHFLKLNIGGRLVTFTGNNLQIKCMTGENVILDGEILTFEFSA